MEYSLFENNVQAELKKMIWNCREVIFVISFHSTFFGATFSGNCTIFETNKKLSKAYKIVFFLKPVEKCLFEKKKKVPERWAKWSVLLLIECLKNNNKQERGNKVAESIPYVRS